MKIGSIIEYHVPGKKSLHTGKVIKINKKSVIVIDDKTDLKVKILISEIGHEYQSKSN